MKRGATIAILLLLAGTVLVVVTGAVPPKESHWNLCLVEGGWAQSHRPDLVYRLCRPLGLPWGELRVTISEAGPFDGIPIDEFR